MSKTTKIALIAVAAIVILIVLPTISAFNSLTTLSAEADKQWANVEVVLQNRWDLLPRLETYLKTQRIQETTIFSDITMARTKYTGAQTTEDKVTAANQVETGIGRLLAVMENYPQIKTNDLVLQLGSQTEGAQNRINVERMRYNEDIKNYNIKTKMFPSNVIAGMFGFEERIYFELKDRAAENMPQVNL